MVRFIQTILFSVVSFHMQSSYHCYSDSLTLYDGKSIEYGTPNTAYCGSKGPDQFRTSTNAAILVFKSDNWYNHPGRITNILSNYCTIDR